MGLFKLFSRGKPAPEPVREEPAAPAEGPLTLQITNVQGQGERERQEDSFAIANAAGLELQRAQGLLALVADGMGGMEDGKAASQWTAECFLQLFQEREGEDVPSWFYRSAHAVSVSAFPAAAAARWSRSTFRMSGCTGSAWGTAESFSCAAAGCSSSTGNTPA